uniref:CD59 glycoprotein-like protein n=1 Tax=Callorhinchus milii TaxID=7868 RepID=V9LKE3_CALMI
MAKLAVVFALVTVLYSAEALLCHHCVSLDPKSLCQIAEEMCEPRNTHCIFVNYPKSNIHIRRCVPFSECHILEETKNATDFHTVCCDTDLCN